MALFENNKPGSTIPKAPMEKKGIFKFFEIYGRKWWKLVELNLLYFITFIPALLGIWLADKANSYAPYALILITAVCFGPATSAMTKITRNYTQERNAFVLSDFLETFKKDFRQSLIMGIIDVVFALGFSVAIPSYKQWAEQSTAMYVPFIICLSCLIVFFMMHFYIYQMIVSTNLTMRQIFKNAFFLVSLGVKSCIYTLLVWVLLFFLIWGFMPYSVFIIPFFPFSFINFVTSFNCYPVIRKHVIQPFYDARGEENPEFAYLKHDPDEAVFEDRPELDKPVKEKTRQKKGKTIS